MSYIPQNSASILPSYYLWDSSAALAHYLATGEYLAVTDFPRSANDKDDNGVGRAHAILREAQKALLVAYPFADGFHFAIPRLPGSTVNTIANQVGLSADDVPLAMFAGLIHESLTYSIDTSSGALSQAVQMVKDAISHAESGDYVGMAKGAIDDANAAVSSYAKSDQNYYQVSVEARQFLAVTTGPGWDKALAAVKSAAANGTSIADALQSIADAGVRASYFAMVANLHRANEQQAQRAVNDSAFPGYMAALGYGDTDAARTAWLAAAGAGAPKRLAINPGVLAAVAAVPRKPILSAAAFAAAASVASPSKKRTIGAIVIGGAIGLVALVAIGAKHL